MLQSGQSHRNRASQLFTNRSVLADRIYRHRTYRAFMRYLYTGYVQFLWPWLNKTKLFTFRSICFAPLSSTYSVERALALAKDSETPFISREQYNLANATHSPGDISDCLFGPAPKACTNFVIVWHAASIKMSPNTPFLEIDMLELKQISLEHIEDSLTPENVMKEILSAFASTYDEVYESELRYLKSHWVRSIISTLYSLILISVC